MLEYVINKKALAGLALLAASSFGMAACGDSCGVAYGQQQNGIYMSKEPVSEDYSQQSLGLNDDGCPSGCHSTSNTCCWCPDK